MTEQIVKRRDKRALILALVNLGSGLLLALGLFLLVVLVDYLPVDNSLRSSGGGDIAAFILIPFSFLFTLIGLIMTIVALVRKREPRPKLQLNMPAYVALGLLVVYYPLFKLTSHLGSISYYIAEFGIPLAFIVGLVARVKGLIPIMISMTFVIASVALLGIAAGF